jgi:hypothetical protein
MFDKERKTTLAITYQNLPGNETTIHQRIGTGRFLSGSRLQHRHNNPPQPPQY